MSDSDTDHGSDNPFPNFFIVGAAKAGTTSLWNYLRDHPDIHLGPIKEPNYFAFGPEGPNVTGPAPAEELRARLHVDSVTDEACYLSLFESAADHQVTGEASVRYLYMPDSAARIAAARPDARIIVMLRDPVARLRSHHTMNRSWGLEPLGLEAALDAEDRRVEAGWGWDWHYTRVGRYGEQIERYLRSFDREQILFVGHDEFSRDPVSVVRRVCHHVGAAVDHQPDTSIRAKEAYIPRSATLDALRRSGGGLAGRMPSSVRRRAGALLRRVNHEGVEPLNDELAARLTETFRADLTALESLIDGPVPWPSDHDRS